MDATMLVIHECWSAFYEKFANHFKNRKVRMHLTCDIVRQHKTRSYQYFTFIVDFDVEDGAAFPKDHHKVAIKCYYNLERDLHLYVYLGKFDKFEGKADFQYRNASFVYFMDDVIRSFADASPQETRAIIKV